MAGPRAGPRPKPLIALDLALVLLVRPWLKRADAVGRLPSWVPALPIGGRTWLLTLVALALLGWWRFQGLERRIFGLVLSQPWRRTIALAVGGLVASVAISTATDPILTKWFGAVRIGGLAQVEGNLQLMLAALGVTWVLAAVGEELFYRGLLMGGLRHLLGLWRGAFVVALLAQAVVFGLAHSYQGPNGAVSAGLSGVLYGGLVSLGRGSLAPAILAHGLQDSLGFVLLFLGVLSSSP